jgi:hypothetical protein
MNMYVIYTNIAIYQVINNQFKIYKFKNFIFNK